jgi:hypothetical protein
MDENIRKELEAILSAHEDAPPDVINKKIQAAVDKYNSGGIVDFDG